jgi:hypothetical protein
MSTPTHKVFQAKQGGDTFLVLDVPEHKVTLYQTVETLLHPGPDAADEWQDKPFVWAEEAGMMYVLSEVCSCDFTYVADREHADRMLESMEEMLEKL